MTMLGANRRRVYLMRHGDVAYYDSEGQRVAEPDKVPLTELGLHQAQAMGKALTGIDFDRAVCTGLLRTVQTAEAILEGRDGPELETIGALREIKSGNVPLNRDQALNDMVYAFERAAEPGARFAFGEPLADFYERISVAIEDLLTQDGWDTMLIAAHGGVNRAIFSWLTGAGLAGLSRFEQDTACLNIFDLDVEDGKMTRYFLRMLNWRPDEPWRLDDRRTNQERYFSQRADA
ncbi:MAG: histidine phosphatase family protein [Minwuia sp.]|uniref:histidine phosphatase family protein n=1 Tax=Minwuia sp. TaxID=2493630 RepID=UPI003A8B904C